MFFDSNLQKPLKYNSPAQFGRVTKWLCGGLQIRIRGFKSLSALLFLIVILLIISSKKGSADVLINEVMYDPELNENYYEWIELYNPTNQSINLTGWSITDNSATDFLEGDFDHGNGTTIMPSYSYAIIADYGTKIYENFSIPDNTIKLYVDDSSIGNGLGNNGDKLILKNETETTIDTVEWIIDYPDVSGTPADSVEENHSLSRYQNIDTDNSSNDFYDCSNPTPGSENIITQESNFYIELYPSYIPKIDSDSEHSLPFKIKIKIDNYLPNETYDIRSYIVGNISSSLPASQTWDGTSWKYSNIYTSTITTDEYGNWSGWRYLRFKKDYNEYTENIKNNSLAYLKVKIKKDNITQEISKIIYLLDMDNSSSNGTPGGYAIGVVEQNNTFLEGKTVIIENISSVITGIYETENNEIDDGFFSRPGYFKISSPIDSDYTIKFLQDDGSIIQNISNVTIKQGNYGVDITSFKTSYSVKKGKNLDIPLTVKNTGDFYDTLDINIRDITQGWNSLLEKEKVSLNPKEAINLNLHIIPSRENVCIIGTVIISVTSENDVGESDGITIKLEILAPDLTITNINIYNEKEENTNIFGQGEIVKIKAFLKNLGNYNAKNTSVKFYYDDLNNEHYIGSKSYDSIDKYQKYPTVEWDTKDVKPGDHTIFVIADEENYIDELYESNNKLSVEIYIFDTCPSQIEEGIFITELYYNTHPWVNNEYITIYNCNSINFDISSLYITNDPLKTKVKQTKIFFPNNTIISPRTCLYLAQNASAYNWEIGKKPDFEYYIDSDFDVPQMHASDKFILSNNGGIVALKDWYNHTLDVVVYGEVDYNYSGWNGTSISDSESGVVLKRNYNEKGIPIDTNTSNDWLHPRRYGIGQSDFSSVNISFNGEITTFVSPDNSFETIIGELRKAKESINLNIYEFTDVFLCDELIAALLRGVSVNIFLEGSPIGGITDEEKYILKRIVNYGGNIRFIVSDKDRDVYARYIFDHGKYLVIDNKTVIVESCNWVNTGIPKDPSYGNREWGIILRNKDVAEYFLNVFLDDWNPEHCDSYSFNSMNLTVTSDFYMDKSVYSGLYEPQFKANSFNGNFSITPVFSPDTSFKAIYDMINLANDSIYIEQLYIYKDWNDGINPFVKLLVNKSNQGVDIKVILNYNPNYEPTNDKNNITKQYLEENGVEVKFVYTNWSYFSNVHNKGMIIDNRTVLVSSINWNENSVSYNREAGIIIENSDVANYYVYVFFYDWNLSSPAQKKQSEKFLQTDFKNTIYIVIIFTMTFGLIARDWRKRQWI
jgi:cardiolipin synthase